MISQTFADKISKQDYTKKALIEGVKIIDISYFTDDGGAFCEIARILDDAGVRDHFAEFKLKQINWSQIEPGLIKAGHLHKNQEDIWFVPPTDRVLVGLMDVRKGSPTLGAKMRFVLGAGRARLLYIPRGVVHGCANPYTKPMTLIYLVNQNWTDDPEKSDEFRIDYSEFGEGFWEMVKG
ncbi:MAG TPA: spore coat protein [Candidatus Jacksonbacteria bacterium]|nr:spore coat protein [Candidatus Jacksonbacteria bacterium]